LTCFEVARYHDHAGPCCLSCAGTLYVLKNAMEKRKIVKKRCQKFDQEGVFAVSALEFLVLPEYKSHMTVRDKPLTR